MIVAKRPTIPLFNHGCACLATSARIGRNPALFYALEDQSEPQSAVLDPGARFNTAKRKTSPSGSGRRFDREVAQLPGRFQALQSRLTRYRDQRLDAGTQGGSPGKQPRAAKQVAPIPPAGGDGCWASVKPAHRNARVTASNDATPNTDVQASA